MPHLEEFVWILPSDKRCSWWEPTFLFLSPALHAVCQRTGSGGDFMVHTAASSGEMLLSNLVAQGNQKGLKNLLPDAGWFNSCLGNCLLCLGWKIIIFIISCPRSVKKRIIAVLSLFGSCAALMAGESGFPEKGKCWLWSWAAQAA